MSQKNNKKNTQEESSESDEELGDKAKGKKKTAKKKDSDSDDDSEKSHKKKKKPTQKESDSDDEPEETTKKKKKAPIKKRPRKLPEFSNEVVPRIVLLGATGAGKSHLGNTLLGNTRFIVSDNPESCTSEASDIVRGFWLGEPDGQEFEIIDTPGLNDSEGRDTEHIQNIVENLRDYKYVNMFLIVRNGHEIRMTNTYSDMLRTFEMIFGDTFWKHAMFDVSGSLKEKDVKGAKKWIKAIRNGFPNAKKAKTVFLDVEEEDEDFHTNVATLWQSCSTLPRFGCKDIKVVLAEKDRLEEEKEQLTAENEENAKKLKALEEAKSQELEEYEEKLKEAKIQAETAREEERKLAEGEKKEEIQKLLDQVKEKETELHQISADKTTVVMEKDFELKLQKQENLAKEHVANEKKNLTIKYEDLLKEKEKEHRMEIDDKIRKERENENEKNKHVQGLMEQIRALKETNKFSEVSAKEKIKYDTEKQIMRKEHEKEIEGKDQFIQSLQDEISTAKELKIKEENQRKQKVVEEEKEELVQKTKTLEEEKHTSVKNFQLQYPALLSSKDMKTPVKSLFKEAKQDGSPQRFHTDVEIKLKQGADIKNRKGEVAARFFETNHHSYGASDSQTIEEKGYLQKFTSQFTPKPKKFKKTMILLGLTGSGKTTFIDALINYIYDTRFEDPYRLKLVRMTKEESEKSQRQAISQTDNIVVYKVNCIPGMNINYQLTLVDTPGFGDTRGVDYDKKLMQNIEDLFKSKTITHLDAIAFVAKAGDARLTAQQNYIFESILHIFGKDVKDNLISILTNYDGQKVNILDSFEAAKMSFVGNFPINSAAMFLKPPLGNQTVDHSYLTGHPGIAQYQKFFDEADKLTKAVSNMIPKSLDQTIRVLNDREKIQVELQGVQDRVMELLLQKDKIQMETDICNQHAANAKANEDTEYEVEEQTMKKEQLKPGTYVTNCLDCNRTCHHPCFIPKDEDKSGCAAMRAEHCKVCPQNCHWARHVNNPHRIVFETVKVKKKYEEMIKRHAEFIAKHGGHKTVVDALQAEADAASKEIQDRVPRISQCLESLKENALRPNMSSSVDYLDQMISAEEYEQKDGYQKRITQLRIEKDKAKMLNMVQDGKDIMNAKK